MNQADISKVVSRLRIPVKPRHRNLKNVEGPEGRLKKLRKTVTALVKFERIELNYNRADEARGYAERLISEAIRHGDCHKPTMEIADYWLLEKQLVHKLFKVLVPRYKDYTISYTRLLPAPTIYPGSHLARSVLELRGNIYPPLVPDTTSNRGLLHNVLLDEARREFRAKKYAEIAASVGKSSVTTPSSHTEAPVKDSSVSSGESPSSKPEEDAHPSAV
ncbi:39S ribosomal protein L17, mitochondrial [Schistocerca americana]|uniref:39S ribosomal protein L17, mitochondrial n=1 Tax=Schistocerca americana TaxID=7009 RepID=UPI001F50250D|nr:39S ribosomal protein L17, mitochondrial [Schistocerca americana]